MKIVSLTFFALLLLSGCAGAGALSSMTSIQVEPSTNVRLAKGVSQSFTARAFYSDGSSRDVTNEVAWNVRQSNSSAGIVAVRGITGNQIVGGETGESEVTATLQDVTTHVTLTVIPATLSRIDVTPTARSIAVGTSLQFTATAVYSDDSTLDISTDNATWDTSDSMRATVVLNSGMVTAVTAGSVGIRASFGGLSGITMLTVSNATLDSITVTPAASSTPLGVKVQLTATGHFSEGTTLTTQDLTASVAWTTSDATIATVGDTTGLKGYVTPVALGTATLTATLLGVPGSTTLTITAATLKSIAVTAVASSKAMGLTDQFTATGTYTDNSTQNITTSATWTSSNNSIATISNAGGSQGLATAGNTSGTVTITAALSGKTGTKAFDVTNAVLQSITLTSTYTKTITGGTEQLTATGTYTNGTQDITTSVTYASSDATKITVSNAGGSHGLMTGVANGTSNLTATLSGVTSAAYPVTNVSLSSIAVTPANPTVNVGNTKQFIATATFDDATTRVVTNDASLTWSSSDSCRLTMNYNSTKGLGHANFAGNPTVTANIGGISGSTIVAIP